MVRDKTHQSAAPSDASARALGSVTVVGLGIRLDQLTMESQQAISCADVVFVVSNNIPGIVQLYHLNSDVRLLQGLYARGKSRMTTYDEMTDAVMAEVRNGKNVCFCAYGHAGMFANPTHAAIRQARAEGFRAEMLPGISALDCMFADLGLDPAPQGCQSFEASDFMLRDRIWDPYSMLVIWQAALIGVSTYPEEGTVPPGFGMFRGRLVKAYGPDHEGILYIASMYPLCDPIIEKVKLSELRAEQFKLETTLVIMPAGPSPRRNEEFAKLLI